MPKILTCDIETMPIEVLVWDVREPFIGLNQIQKDWSIAAFGAKWLDQPEFIYQDTGGRGRRKVRDDSHILKHLWALFNEADIVIAQNGISFDIKKINSRLLEHGYGPYSPIRVIDTVRVSRKHFGMTSHKLAWLSDKLTDSPKSEHNRFPGFELWIECLKDNPEAWIEMRDYNERDVIATEKVYLAQRPWISSHPNMGAFSQAETPVCPKCGSTSIQRRGTAVTQQGRYNRYFCNDCRGWTRSKQGDLTKEERSILLV